MTIYFIKALQIGWTRKELRIDTVLVGHVTTEQLAQEGKQMLVMSLCPAISKMPLDQVDPFSRPLNREASTTHPSPISGVVLRLAITPPTTSHRTPRIQK